MKYLFKNAYIVSDNRKCDILIDNGTIVDINDEIIIDKSRSDDLELINLEGRIIIRGFADAHLHLDKALLNETYSNESGTLKEAIQLGKKLKRSFSKKDVKERALKTINMCRKHGTFAIRTNVDIDEIVGLNSLDALLELKDELKDEFYMQIVAFPQEGIQNSNKNLLYLEEALKRGADIIGGIPATEENPIGHIKKVFELAIKYDVDIDMHIDETDDPKSLTTRDLAEITILEGYKGRVTAGHCCSLSANNFEDIKETLNLIKEAEIHIIALPSTNLYLQGRNDVKDFRRGITRVKDLIKLDIPVMIASDNIRDPFNPFGNGNLLEAALITAHGCQMGGTNDLNSIFRMVTDIPMKLLNQDTGFKIGEKARFIVLNSYEPWRAIISQSRIFGKYHLKWEKVNS